MTADKPDQKNAASSRLLLFTLLLALLAGGASLYWTLKSTPKEPSSGGMAQSAPETPLTQQGPGGTGPAHIAPNSVTGAITGSAPGSVQKKEAPFSSTAPKAESPAATAVRGDERTDAAQGETDETPDDARNKALNENGERTREKAESEKADGKSQEERASAQNSPENTAPGVILYGKGMAVNPERSVVRGNIPRDQRAVSGPWAASGGGPRGDSLIGPAFVEDLAAFLADNYWPEGTHPMAVGRGLTTASVKWTNLRYGAKLAGFSIAQDDPPAARRRILDYAYTPSMLRALYRLHAENFFLALERQALSRASGPQGQYFSNAQVASLFNEYAHMARALAACAALVYERPGLWVQADAYAAHSSAAALALDRFISGMDGEAAARKEDEAAYYAAVQRRESSRNLLAASLNYGDARALDADSRIYTTLWLLRRGRDNHASLAALREIFTDAAGRLESLASKYGALPARQIAR